MNHLLETKNGKTGGKKKFFNSDIPFNIVTGVILTFVAIIYILPLLYIVNASFSSAEAIFSGKMLFIPKGVNIEGYKLVFQYDSFWRSYLNTIFYCILALIIAIPFTVMAAYPLSLSLIHILWKELCQRIAGIAPGNRSLYASTSAGVKGVSWSWFQE